MTRPFTLRINGHALDGYKSVRLRYSMEAVARSAEVAVSPNTLDALDVAEGDEMELDLHGETVFYGYVDSIPLSYDTRTHEVSIVGLSRPADIEVCSAIYESASEDARTGEWRNRDLSRIALDLLAPYNIGYVVDSTARDVLKEPFRIWRIEEGETVLECITRAAKARGLMIYGDEGTNVIIARASRVLQKGYLALGLNVQRGSRSGSANDRHSHYVVKGQYAGDDLLSGEQIGRGYFRTEDQQVTRYRPLILVSETGGARERKHRAEYERNRRAGLSRRLTYEVAGLVNPIDFQPWQVNRLVTVKDEKLQFKGSLLVVSVDLSFTAARSSSGSVAHIEVAPPEAFDVRIPPPKKRKKVADLW